MLHPLHSRRRHPNPPQVISFLFYFLGTDIYINTLFMTFEQLRLFVCGFSSDSRIFHSYGDVNITGEWLQILTHARYLWPFSSEGSLTCHTYCDTGHPSIMVISEDPWHSHLLPSGRQCSCHFLFLRLMSVGAGIRSPNLPRAGRINRPRHRRG